MAGTYDPTTHSFNGKEIQQLNEGIFEKVYELPTLNEFHEVKTGIKAKEQVALFGLLGMVGVAGGATCSTSVDTNQIGGSEKTWDPVQIEVRLTQCIKDLLPSFHAWAAKNGVNKPDMEGSAWLMFVEERLTYALEEAVLRHVWFGDTSLVSVTATPSGLLTAGVNKLYFNAFNGLWNQIFAIVTGDSTKRVTISENALGTKVLQSVLGASTALTTFRALINNADMRLRNQPDKIMVVTQSLFDNYADYLESQSFDASFLRLESGFTALRYRGVMIIPFEFWDRTITASFDNGTTYYRPHRAVLTVAENLQIGLEEDGSFSNFNIWYEKKEKTNYIDAEFSLHALVIENYLIQTAY